MTSQRVIDAPAFARLVAGQPVNLDGVTITLADIGFAAMRDALDAAGVERGVCSECDGPLTFLDDPRTGYCYACGLFTKHPLVDAEGTGGGVMFYEQHHRAKETYSPPPGQPGD